MSRVWLSASLVCGLVAMLACASCAAKAKGSSESTSKVLGEAGTAAAASNRAGVAKNLDVAVLGGGCFWGMEELLRKLDGVVATEVGYAGGSSVTASYSIVSTGATGHAESVKVVFDPARLSYEKLIRYFFRIHDPTTQDRQENDRGHQYRSVIFFQSQEQQRVAQAMKDQLDRSGKLSSPVVTEIVPAAPFIAAEAHHQKYLQKNPDGYSCHFERNLNF